VRGHLYPHPNSPDSRIRRSVLHRVEAKKQKLFLHSNLAFRSFYLYIFPLKCAISHNESYNNSFYLCRKINSIVSQCMPTAILCCPLIVLSMIAVVIILSLIPTYLPTKELGNGNNIPCMSCSVLFVSFLQKSSGFSLDSH
jgi:hypothetical protein